MSISNVGSLALLKIERQNLPTLPFAGSADVRQGEEVALMANPFGAATWFSSGVVASIGERQEGLQTHQEWIRIAASWHPGGDGGPVVNRNGEILGMLQADLSGVGFATILPSDRLVRLTQALRGSRHKEPVQLGATFTSLNQKLIDYYKREKGVVVMDVEQPSPAFRGGLKPGDLLIAINDYPVDDIATLQYRLGMLEPGDMIVVEYVRDYHLQESVVTLEGAVGERTAEGQGYHYQGLLLHPLTGMLRSRLKVDPEFSGIVVSAVKEGSKAYNSGFRSGDVILRADGKPTTSLEDFRSQTRGKTVRRFELFRNGLVHQITMNKD